MAKIPEDKDPRSEIIRGFNWSDHLLTGDTISTSSWEAEGSIAVEDLGKTATTTSVKITGGKDGNKLDRARNIITTVQGEKLAQSLLFDIKDL